MGTFIYSHVEPCAITALNNNYIVNLKQIYTKNYKCIQMNLTKLVSL